MHQGKIVALYREYANLTQEALAEEMGVHLRTIQRIESADMIRNTTRRWFLVGLLGIPANMLALEGEPPWSKQGKLPLNNDTMNFFEHELDMRWNVYKTSGILASQGLDVWMTQLHHFVVSTQGTPWARRALTILCMSYQLQANLLRDKQLYHSAHTVLQKAFKAAHEMHNDEMLASSLLWEGTVYVAQDNPAEALKHINGALEIVKNQSYPRLRGRLLQASAEAYALTQQPQECWRSIGLAAHILGREDEGTEHNHVIFSPSSVVGYKGLCALFLHDYDYAITLFDKGLATCEQNFSPKRARFLSRKAIACYGVKDIEGSILCAQEALQLAIPLDTRSTINRVRTLYTTLLNSPYKQEKGVRSLGAALATYDATR